MIFNIAFSNAKPHMKLSLPFDEQPKIALEEKSADEIPLHNHWLCCNLSKAPNISVFLSTFSLLCLLTYFFLILYVISSLVCLLLWIVPFLRCFWGIKMGKKNQLIIFNVELGLMSLFDWYEMEVSWYKQFKPSAPTSCLLPECMLYKNVLYFRMCY